MSAKQSFSSQNSATDRWINLALMSMAVFYIVQIAFDLLWKNACANLAVDYCAFWSAGRVANTSGYTGIYDLNLLAQVQRPLFPASLDPKLFATVPTPFFPAFILPFQLFALLQPLPGFGLWSLINLLGFGGYLYFFSGKLLGYPLPRRLFLMFLLSLPVFLDLFWGQVNLWLMVCMGEFMRAMLEDRPYHAGLWLGCLLLKPQILILIIPVLIIQRSIKVLGGFAIGGVIIFLASVGLAGLNGIYALVKLWFGYAKGLPTNGPEIMMNWRMLALNLNNYMPSAIGWTLAVVGIAVTIGMVISIWRFPIRVDSPNFHIAVLGLLAATGLVAWHSHLSSLMIIIPSLLILYEQKRFPERMFFFWVFLPPAVRFIVFILAILIQASVLPTDFSGLLNFALGLSSFVLNIYILFWAYSRVVMGNSVSEA